MPRTNQLTIKQRKFIKAYVETNGNGPEAALAAYDTNDRVVAKQIAYENLSKPDVKSALELALDKAGLNDNTISTNLASIAHASPEKPLSAAEIIKANELVLKLLGRFPTKTTVKTTVSLSQRLGDHSYSELKDKLAGTRNKSSELLEDLD